jgi:cobalt-zinc-cadmium efflux system outer membrane protein
MKSIGLSAVVLVVVGCGGAPEPFPWEELERREPRFATNPRQVLDKSELTLEDALAVTDTLNPGLAAERRNVDIAAAQQWEARLYPNPSVLLEIEDYRTRDGATLGKAERTAGLSLPLVFSGRLGKAESAAQAARDVAALTYVWRRREILAETQRAFMTVLSTRRTLDLTRESRDLARTARDVAEERLRAQAVPEMEALKTAVALSKAEIELKRAERDATGAFKALQAAMGDADFPVAKIQGELAASFIVPSLDTLRGLATGAHPRLGAASKAKEAAELEVAVARTERIPDPQLEVLAGRDPEDASIIEAGVSIPLPLFNRNQAKIAKAEARVRQAEHEIDAVRNDLLLKLGESHRAIGTAQEAVAIYRDEILPKAEKALAQTSEGYRLGKFGYLDLLDAQRTLAEARSAYAAALTELNLAAVELEKLSGLKLERRSP